MRNARGKWSTTAKHVVDEGIRPYARKPRKNAKEPGKLYQAEKGYQILWTCGRGHRHKEWFRYLEGARDAREDRRSRVRHEPTWCPRAERERARATVAAEQARAATRTTFHAYAEGYTKWAKGQHRSWRTTQSQVKRLTEAFGPWPLDSITMADAEAFLTGLRTGEDAVAPATVNRYRDRLSGMFKRAKRLGLVMANPVSGIPKSKEPGGRVMWLTTEGEQAIKDALPEERRPAFGFSVHTGLRWSEQMSLQWQDVDMPTGFVIIPRSKHGEARRVPLNSVAQAILVDLGSQREHPDSPDPTELVFKGYPREAHKFFPKAVERAQAALHEAGKDTSRLDGYTWHGNRHTFGSRLAMAGVPDRTIQELGGWKDLKMVKRYSHLSADYLHEAVARLVESSSPVPRTAPATSTTLQLHPRQESRSGVS
jgi:integrase